jgi:peptidyl-prolyl cis-trans isomerase A (cyclophilin A)
MDPSASTEQAPEIFRAQFDTSKGSFTIEVTRSWAPAGADRFYNLVKNGFYDGARFFRVLPGFVVQFGIPGDPEVARLWRTAQFPDDPVTQSNVRGMITFATAGPNSRTTQVFVNLADNTSLDAMGFAPFGRVAEGMDIVGQLHSGYGEGAPRGRGPEQGRIQTEGNAYLERQFPKLDHIQRAAIVEA